MNAWQDQTWWLQIFCKTRRVFLFFFHMSPTDSVFVGLSICVRVWEVLAKYLWNISRAAHSGWLNKTQSQPLRLSSVILPKTAEQTRLWQAFSVGLFFFFLFFFPSGGHNRRAALTLNQNTGRPHNQSCTMGEAQDYNAAVFNADTVWIHLPLRLPSCFFSPYH